MNLGKGRAPLRLLGSFHLRYVQSVQSDQQPGNPAISIHARFNASLVKGLGEFIAVLLKKNLAARSVAKLNDDVHDRDRNRNPGFGRRSVGFAEGGLAESSVEPASAKNAEGPRAVMARGPFSFAYQADFRRFRKSAKTPTPKAAIEAGSGTASYW